MNAQFSNCATGAGVIARNAKFEAEAAFKVWESAYDTYEAALTAYGKNDARTVEARKAERVANRISNEAEAKYADFRELAEAGRNLI